MVSGALDLIFQAKGPLSISEGLEGKGVGVGASVGGVRDAWA